MINNSFLEYIIDLLSSFGTIKYRAMFGGYGLYYNNFIFAIIVDEELYFKVDDNLAKEFAKYGSCLFSYLNKGKVITMNYSKVPIDIIEDEENLKIWFDKTIAIAIKAGLIKNAK